MPQIYSQLVASQEDLLAQKDENARLNTYLDQILKEIESRAPGLKRQREDINTHMTSALFWTFINPSPSINLS